MRGPMEVSAVMPPNYKAASLDPPLFKATLYNSIEIIVMLQCLVTA